MTPRFNIGDWAWNATFDSSDAYVLCPDCGGTGRIRVVMHDETTRSIECRNCAVGYDPPTGRVRVYDRKPRAELREITGMEIKPSGITYHSGPSNWWNNFEDCDLFATEAEAMARANERAAELDAEERAKVLTKEKDTRTWAWNASYHRRCIKEAQKNLDYHTAKLNVAAIKAKGE